MSTRARLRSSSGRSILLTSAAVGPSGFTVTLSAGGGTTGTPVTVTVSPAFMVWATGEALTYTSPGIAGTFSIGQPSAGTSTPVVGTFTPSSGSGTSGAIAVAGSSMTNLSGPQAYAVSSAVATGFTMTQLSSTGFVGQAEQITVTPTPAGASWPAGLSIIFSETPLAGAFSPSATLNPPSGSTASATVAWTPSAAGTASISCTNNGGLPAPASLTYTVSASSGTSAPTVAVSAAFNSRRVMRRHTYAGNPAGYATTFNKGSGTASITVTLSAGVSTGLFIRLHDALSSGATATLGTGTVIQPVMQVPGITTLASGANAVNLTVPAGLAPYYLDVGTSSDMTNAVRLAKPFSCGGRAAGQGTSHWGAFMSNFNYDTPNVAALSSQVAISPYGVIYSPEAVGWAGYNGSGFDTNACQVPGDPASSPYPAPGAAEFLRVMIANTGVAWELCGSAGRGGSLKDVEIEDPASNHSWGIFTQAFNGDYDFDVLLSIQGANDTNGYVSTRPWIARRLGYIINGLKALGSSGFVSILNATPLWSGDDTQGQTKSFLGNADAAVTAGDARVLDWADAGGDGGINGHGTPLTKIRYGRNFARAALQQLGTARGGVVMNLGPKIISATRTGTVITAVVQHDKGTALVPYAWNSGSYATATAWTESTPSAALLGTMFGVYDAGHVWDYIVNTANRWAVASAAVVDAVHISITLASDPGPSAVLDLYAMMDLAPVGGTPDVPAIKDNWTDCGISYGAELRRNMRPVAVIPVSPVSQAITLDPIIDTAPGAWLLVGGTGAGLPLAGAGTDDTASSVEVLVGGGAYAVPRDLLVLDNNTWAGKMVAPAAASGIAISARIVGTPASAVSGTFNSVTARNLLPSSIRADAVVQYDILNAGTLFADAAATQPVVQMGPIGAIKDALGTASNTVTQVGANGWYLDERQYSQIQQQNPDPRFHRPVGWYERFPGRLLAAVNPSWISAVAGDFTILYVGRGDAYATNAWWIGNAAGSPTFGTSGKPAASISVTGYNQFTFVRTGNTGQVSVVGQNQTDGKPLQEGRLGIFVLRYSNTTGILRLWQKDQYVPTGAEVSSAALTDRSTAIFNTFMLGANAGLYSPSYGSDRFHEFTAFGREATDAERDALIAYAINKWNSA